MAFKMFTISILKKQDITNVLYLFIFNQFLFIFSFIYEIKYENCKDHCP